MSAPTFEQLCAMYPAELLHAPRKTYPQVAFQDCDFEVTLLPGDMLQVSLLAAVHGEPKRVVYGHVLHLEEVGQVVDMPLMGMC